MSWRGTNEPHLGVGLSDGKTQVDILNLSLEVAILMIEPFTRMFLHTSQRALMASNRFCVSPVFRRLQREAGNSFLLTFFAGLFSIIINVANFEYC